MGRPKQPPKPCTVQGCDKSARARGLCGKHYRRLQSMGSTDDPPRTAARQNRLCDRDGCTRKAVLDGFCGYHNARASGGRCSVEDCDRLAATQGLCSKHYMRARRHGSTEDVRRRRPPCSVCGKSSVAFGLCDTHYRQTRPRPKKVQAERECPVCLVTFIPHDSRNRYCSTSCKNRVGSLWTGYRLTIAEYHRLLTSQEGRCAVCKADHRGGDPLVVDHCHDSGAVRGLLCNGCNRGLGCFNDQPESLRAAADYLEAQPR